jgi:hypothetical protein
VEHACVVDQDVDRSGVGHGRRDRLPRRDVAGDRPDVAGHGRHLAGIADRGKYRGATLRQFLGDRQPYSPVRTGQKDG